MHCPFSRTTASTNSLLSRLFDQNLIKQINQNLINQATLKKLRHSLTKCNDTVNHILHESWFFLPVLRGKAQLFLRYFTAITLLYLCFDSEIAQKYLCFISPTPLSLDRGNFFVSIFPSAIFLTFNNDNHECRKVRSLPRREAQARQLRPLWQSQVLR